MRILVCREVGSHLSRAINQRTCNVLAFWRVSIDLLEGTDDEGPNGRARPLCPMT
jgi:hypothetical protein